MSQCQVRVSDSLMSVDSLVSLCQICPTRIPTSFPSSRYPSFVFKPFVLNTQAGLCVSCWIPGSPRWSSCSTFRVPGVLFLCVIFVAFLSRCHVLPFFVFGQSVLPLGPLSPHVCISNIDGMNRPHRGGGGHHLFSWQPMWSVAESIQEGVLCHTKPAIATHFWPLWLLDPLHPLRLTSPAPPSRRRGLPLKLSCL